MKKFLTVLFCAVAMWGCSVKEAVSPQEIDSASEEPVAIGEDAGFVSGMTVVCFSDEMTSLVEADLLSGSLQTKSSELNGALDELGIVSAVPVFPIEECPERFRERERKAGLRNYYYVSFDQTKASVTKAAGTLAAVKGVVSAEPVYETEICDSFNDPQLASQWGFINTNTPGADVNCKPLWDMGIVGNPNVIVAVDDSGVDLSHADLAWNCIEGGKNGSFNFASGSTTIEPMDHGTHVAGTIAAVNNNGKGVCGIAGGDYKAGKKGVRIMSCQFFGSKSNGSSSDAIRWGANHGAVISQNSWNYVNDVDHDGKISAAELERAKNLQIASSERAAIDYFVRYAGCDENGNQLPESPMKGGLVVFSAGNDDIPYSCPASYEKILSVGAIESHGAKASFSSYGDWVDLCAPGYGILSTVPGNQYSSMSGTSMACPHVAGVAALLVSHFGGQGFTNDMLWTKLINGGKPINSNKPIGVQVDAYGAYMFGSKGDPVAVNSFSESVQSNNISLSWELNANSEGDPNYAAMLYASKDRTLLENMNPSKPDKGIITTSVLTSTKEIGDVVSGTISGLEFETEYFVTLSVYSYSRKFTKIAPIKSITTQKNNPPYVTIDLSPVPDHRNYEVWTAHITADDPDGHEVRVTYEAGSAADQIAPDADNGGFMIIVNGPRAEGGTYTGTVKVTDEYGLSASQDFTFTLIDNIPPVVVNEIEGFFFTATGEQKTFPIADIFSDDDGENLSIKVDNSNVSVCHVVSSGENLIVSSLKYGVSEIGLTATDAKKQSVFSKFTVVVREPSVEMTTYPSPVEDILSISTGETDLPTRIRLYNSGGSLIYDETLPSSALKPAQVDMSSFAPGHYGLTVNYGDKEYQRTVVKK